MTDAVAASTDATRRLPRGRHDLTREQIEEDQRLRILLGFAGAMAGNGYARTPIAAVIAHAGVSRETYYRLFSDKLDGFLAAFDLVSTVLLAELDRAVEGPGPPLDRIDDGVRRYLEVLAEHRGEARLFLVEAFAAGPVAIERRAEVQERIAARIAEVLEVGSESGRVTCRMLVAAVSALIVTPLVADDHDAILALGPLISAELRRYHAAGLLT